MTNVLVRDIPEDVHAALVRRAATAGQSLQQYLAVEFVRLARTPTVSDVLARAAARRGGTVGFQQAVADLDVERSEA